MRMALQPGTKLGPYEILAAIGAGGMGEVYCARDTRLDRTVAIKTLPAHLAERPELRERFEREARAVSSLNHPHICRLYNIVQSGWRRLPGDGPELPAALTSYDRAIYDPTHVNCRPSV